MNDQIAVFVDVDGTLINRNLKLNSELVSRLMQKKIEGTKLYLWSSRGEDYSRYIARLHRVDYLFDGILAKPTIIVDNIGINWMQGVEIIRIEAP